MVADGLAQLFAGLFPASQGDAAFLQAVRSFFSIKDRSGQNAGHEASGVSATDVSIHGIHYQAWSPDMSPDEPDRAEKLDVATALADIVSGRHDAADLLMPLVYEEMRGLAQSLLKRESSAHTLQPTALVNEASVRMADQNRVNWQGKTHFFAIGAKTMRRILVDHAQDQETTQTGWRATPDRTHRRPLCDQPQRRRRLGD